MTKTLDKIRYVNLLKKNQSLKSKNSSLYEENEVEYLELLAYGIILENHIYYNRKAEYTCLVQEYLKDNRGEAEVRMFQWEFFPLFKEDNQALELFETEILAEGVGKLENFEIDSKAEEFSGLVNHICSCCEVVIFGPEDSGMITVEQFWAELEKTFLEMKKYLDK